MVLLLCLARFRAFEDLYCTRSLSRPYALGLVSCCRVGLFWSSFRTGGLLIVTCDVFCFPGMGIDVDLSPQI